MQVLIWVPGNNSRSSNDSQDSCEAFKNPFTVNLRNHSKPSINGGPKPATVHTVSISNNHCSRCCTSCFHTPFSLPFQDTLAFSNCQTCISLPRAFLDSQSSFAKHRIPGKHLGINTSPPRRSPQLMTLGSWSINTPATSPLRWDHSKAHALCWFLSFSSGMAHYWPTVVVKLLTHLFLAAFHSLSHFLISLLVFPALPK